MYYLKVYVCVLDILVYTVLVARYIHVFQY